MNNQRSFTSVIALLVCVLAAAAPRVEGQWNDTSAQADLEKHMAGLVNRDRIRAGRPPLKVNSKLSALARGYAEEMVRTGKFSHVNKQGLNPQQRANQAGIECGVYENLGWQKNTGTPVEMVDNVERAFMAEPDGPKNHRYNILFPNHYCMGLGVAMKKKELYAVQVYTDDEPAGSQSYYFNEARPNFSGPAPGRRLPQGTGPLGPSGDPSASTPDSGVPDEGAENQQGNTGATTVPSGTLPIQSDSAATTDGNAQGMGNSQGATSGAVQGEAREIQPEDSSKESFEVRRKRFLQKDGLERKRDEEVHNDLED